MAKALTVDDALDRARRAQEARLEAIRVLAEHRQGLHDAREDGARRLAELEREVASVIGDAERADVRAYNAAVTAGWSATELRSIGFDEPSKKTRARRSTKRRGASNSDAGAPAPEASETAQAPTE